MASHGTRQFLLSLLGQFHGMIHYYVVSVGSSALLNRSPGQCADAFKRFMVHLALR